MARGKGTLRVVVAGDTGPLKKALGGATGTIGKFAGGIGAAVAGAAAFSVKSFADFDKAMTSSLAIMGDVSESMRKDMSDAAREVAKTTRFSAVEAAESYFFLASAGMDAEQSIAALPRVAAFAQAGNFDMARATDLATDAQSALGLTSEDAAKNLEGLNRTTDVFVKANTLANASVEEFATSMTQKAGSALRSVGKDIEEGTAVLAVFADQGIKGERAGTILRATLDGLTDGARKNADAFDKLGVAVFDGEGDMRNMADIVEDLETGLEGMSTEQKLAELNQLGFNRRTSEGILALMGNSDALREYEEELRNAGGTTDEVADKQLQNFWDQLGLIRDQFVDIGLSIGEALMPALESFLSWVQEHMPEIESTIGGVIEGFEILFTGQSDRSAQFSEDVGQGFRDMVADGKVTETFITEDLIPAFESMREWWEENGPEIQRLASVMWTFLVDLAGDSLLTIEGLQEISFGIQEGQWGTFWDGVEKLNRAGWNNLGVGTSDGMQNIIIDFAVGFVKFRSSFQAKWASLLVWVSRLPGRIASFFRGLPATMAGIGRSIVQGLWNGFSAQWDRFTGWVSRLPGAGIVSNIASQLGIGSPSKVMAEQIGGPAVEGIEVGMRERFGDLQRAAAEIPELMRTAEADARTSLMATTGAAGPPPGVSRSGAGEPAEVVVRLEVGPGGDSEVGALVGTLVRKGVIRLSANGSRVRVGG